MLLRKDSLNYIIVVIMAVFMSSCKPILTTELYMQDLDEAFVSKEKLVTPARIAIPISSIDKCDKDRSAIEEILIPYTLNLQFIQCKKISGQMYDLAEYQMDVQIINPEYHKEYSGLFAYSIYPRSEENPKYDTIQLLISPDIDVVLKRFKEKFMQTVKGIDVDIIVNNDSRKETKILVMGAFVNNYPVFKPEKITLSRRDKVEIKLSNVRMSRLMIDKKAGLFSIINDAEFGKTFPDFKGN